MIIMFIFINWGGRGKKKCACTLLTNFDARKKYIYNVPYFYTACLCMFVENIWGRWSLQWKLYQISHYLKVLDGCIMRQYIMLFSFDKIFLILRFWVFLSSFMGWEDASRLTIWIWSWGHRRLLSTSSSHSEVIYSGYLGYRNYEVTCILLRSIWNDSPLAWILLQAALRDWSTVGR